MVIRFRNADGFAFCKVMVIIMMVLLSLAPIASASAQQPPMPTNIIGNITLTANPANISADGTSTSVITVVTVEDPDFAGGKVDAGPITLTTTLGTINGSVQLKNGTATAILTAGTTQGTAAIVAEYVGQNYSRGKVNVTFTAAAPDQTLRGDINRNGRQDTGDATLILRNIVGLSIDPQYLPILPAGDMNCNEKIDTGDATLILRNVVGLPIPKC